jgi:protein O-GlcNAc transferase
MSFSTTTKLLQEAVALHRRGAVEAAGARYREVLRAERDNADAHYYLGMMSCQAGRFDEGAELARKALASDARHANAHILLGRALSGLGQQEEAVKRLQQAIALAPNLAAAHGHLADLLSDLGRRAEAIQSYDRALALAPGCVDDWFNRGVALHAVGRLEEALTSFDRVISANPDLALNAVGWRENALDSFERAIAVKPELALAHLERANVLWRLHRNDEALKSVDRALARDSGLAEAWHSRGNILHHLREYDSALALYDKALALKPDLVEAWLGRGHACRELKHFDEAFAAYDKAVVLKPDRAEVWLHYGEAYTELKQYENAFATYERALSLKADLKYAEGARLHAKMHLCDWANIDTEILHVLSQVRDQKPAGVPFHLLSIPASPADQLQCAKTFVANQGSFSPLWCNEIYSHDRIRIGYLSADFRRHPLAQLAVGLFEHHHKSRFEVTAISFGPDDGSDLRSRIRVAVENFVDARDTPDGAVAELIRRRETDILVDLVGFTKDNRFSVLARRVAPLQVNFLCFTGTMGADCMDYIVADPTTIPEDHFPFYSEKVVWLPDTYQANDRKRPIAERRPTRSECNLPEAAFVFCCFNDTYKIAPKVFAVWMKLLAATEGSVLWLLEANPTAAQNLRREAEAHGISRERLIFAPRVPLADHMARIGLADLFLDTLPYNAHTTASDALWASLPVLTCLGETFAGRVAASLLRAVGLPELVIASLDDYEALALKLARDRSLLKAIKAKLVRNRDSYPLFDTARFTRHIEAAYVTMWERYQRRKAPRAFAVGLIK